MNSLERAARAPERAGRSEPAPPFPHAVRQKISAIPERDARDREGDGAENDVRPLDGFSIARIYTTFQLKRDEYFPEGLEPAAFDMLLDLFLYEWLNRRAALFAGGMRLPRETDLPPGACALVEAGLATVTPADKPDLGPAFSLTRAGRARLTLFFDYMASYMAAI